MSANLGLSTGFGFGSGLMGAGFLSLSAIVMGFAGDCCGCGG